MDFTSESRVKRLRMSLRQARGPRGRSSESEVPARGGSVPAARPRNRRRIVSPSRSRQPSDSSRRDRSSTRRRSMSRRRSFSARSSPPRSRSSRGSSTGRRSASRTRSASGRRARRSSYGRGSSSSSSSGFSKVKEAVKVQELVERLEEVERINAKFEKKEKEKEFKFTKLGCETQYKFNVKIKELFGEKLKVELKKHCKNGLPEKIEELIKEGEKEIDEENHKLKIANEFGFRALKDFTKEDLARDEKEEKKIKVLRKEKKEKEEKSRSYRVNRSGRDSFRSFKDSY